MYLVGPILYVTFSCVYDGRKPTIKQFVNEVWNEYVDVGVYAAMLAAIISTLRCIP